MNPQHAQVAARAGHHCEYCHAPEVFFNFAFEVEHITPVVREGENIEANFALSCRACNSHKSTRIDGPDPIDATVTRLFHPRREIWEQHFYADAETALIQGLTPTGRATVLCLNMNSIAQCAARRHWMRLGLFP